MKVNRYNYITFKHTDGYEFTILKKEDSINPIVGYTQNTYSGKNHYKSDEVHKIKKIDKIYLYLLDQKPLTVIDMNNTSCNCNIIHEYDKPLNDVHDITIKFKTDPTNNSLYNGFNKRPHSLKLRIAISGTTSVDNRKTTIS